MALSEIPFHRPSLSDLERRYVLEALEEQYWGGGRWVSRLEAALKELFGREVVAVSSGTAALHLALTLLLEENPGEVIVPTWTFTATASEVVHAGGRPVLADVNQTLHICAETIEPLITPRTRGVIAVHYAGAPAPMDELLELCERYGLWLLEDACHALPSFWRGQRCGTFGSAATLSFHATKPVASGQGGAILFADPALAEKARLLRRNGMYRLPHQPWEYEVQALGWNYMLTDLQAALALAQLQRLTELWEARRALAAFYTEALSALPHLSPYPIESPATVSWHLYPVFLRGGTAEKRDKLLRTLWEEGIRLNVHYQPLHKHPAYQAFIQARQRFPVADAKYEEVFSLPMWADLPEKAAYQITEALKEALTSL